MNNNKICFLIIAAFVPLVLSAQIQVRLHQPPPNQLKIEHLWWVDLDNTTQSSYTVYLYAEIIKAQKGLIFKARSNSFKLTLGKKRITPKDITDVSNVWYASKYRDYIIRTGSVPQGTYTVCVYVMREQTGNELGKHCITLPVYLPGAPRLISPQGGSKVKQKHPLFTWAPPTPQPPNIQIQYKLKIVEILKGQTKEEAMGANVLWFEKSGLTTRSLGYPASARPLEKTKEYVWQIQAIDASGFPVGKNQGRSEIWQFEYTYRPHPTVPAIPALGVRRSVTRHGNYFEVTLTVVNGHSVDFNDVRIHERISGFQCMNKYHVGLGTSGPLGPERSCELNSSADGKASWFNIELGNLNAHTTKRLRYYVVPILFSSGRPVPYTIGDMHGDVLSVSYRIEGQYYNRRFEDEVYDATADINQAFSSADYLIVTTPQKVFRFNHPNHEDVYKLLSKMAELAKEKNGVLGYLPDYAWCYKFKNLIAPGGSWHTSVSSFEYLLIVGEDDIVPVWHYSNPARVKCSDNWYADIYGDDGEPDLIVGRIVGDNAETLRKPIHASLDVLQNPSTFDYSDALLVSGDEKQWEMVIYAVDSLAAIFHSQGMRVDTVHHEYFTDSTSLLRSALAILGSSWGCMEHDTALTLPPEIEHLRHLTCRWDFYDPSPYTGIDYPDPPADLGTLRSLLTVEDATLVEALRRGIPGTYLLFPEGVAWNAGEESIAVRMENKDIYYWFGHGGACAWNIYAIGGHFGRVHPLIYSNSCLTGGYDGIYGAPESSFNAGVGVFIGATEVSYGERGIDFFLNYWPRGSSKTAGQAFTFLKRTVAREGDWYWVAEYNFYGDPKFGGGD
jgi:hypothetical protein